MIVDVAAAFEGHTEYIQRDKIHPNEAGHYVIAQEYVKTLAELGLGTAEELTTPMPETQQSSNALQELLNKIAEFFRNIIEKVRSIFGA